MPELAEVSRRRMLMSAAGAGAAGIAVGSLGGMAAPATHVPAAHFPAGDVADGETIVAHIRDAAAGEVDIYRGTSHTRVIDRELAARIVRASR